MTTPKEDAEMLGWKRSQDYSGSWRVEGRLHVWSERIHQSWFYRHPVDGDTPVEGGENSALTAAIDATPNARRLLDALRRLATLEAEREGLAKMAEAVRETRKEREAAKIAYNIADRNADADSSEANRVAVDSAANAYMDAGNACDEAESSLASAVCSLFPEPSVKETK